MAKKIKMSKKEKEELLKKKNKKIALTVGVILLCAALVAGIITTAYFVGKKHKKTAENTQTQTSTQTQKSDYITLSDSNTNKEEHKLVKIEMENGGEFEIELYPEYAPKTCENFVKLVNDGFYDGITFHRVVEDFMAQGGDPEGTGMGGSKEKIKGEFSSNGFTQNKISHQRGVISMARSQAPDSASSQFFICYGDASFLDGDYAAFGKVVKGMEVVDDFLKVERTYNSSGELASPKQPIKIKKATVVK